MIKDPKSYPSSFKQDPLASAGKKDRKERLGVSLEVYYREMKQLEFKLFELGEKSHRERFESIAKLLEKSAEGLRTGNLELGWEALNAAQRQETQIYYEIGQSKGPLQNFGRDRFKGIALSVYTEGNNKLTSWRKTMINGLLEENGKLKINPHLSEVLQAQQVLSENHTNVYRRLTILRSQIQFLEIVAGLAILAWIFILLFKPCPDEYSGSVFSQYLTLSSLTFGVLGACISGILGLEKRSTQQKIPDQLEYYVYTIARPLVGAVSALAVVIFVLAGILDIGSQTPGLYLAAAFAAGFSERLLEFGTGKLDERKKP